MAFQELLLKKWRKKKEEGSNDKNEVEHAIDHHGGVRGVLSAASLQIRSTGNSNLPPKIATGMNALELYTLFRCFKGKNNARLDFFARLRSLDPKKANDWTEEYLSLQI